MAHIEINDLIGEAVANASERRKYSLGEDDVLNLPEQDMNQITGGALSTTSFSGIVFKPSPPIICGIIAQPIELLA